jgi:uncharacterized LabA/DUF88 family protein
MINPEERIAIFIDGPNLHAILLKLGWQIDYGKLRDALAPQQQKVGPFYYTALKKKGIDGIRRLTDWLQHHGFVVVAKTLVGGDHAGSVAAEVIAGMVEHAAEIDHYLLFSCDGAFVNIVQKLRAMGKRVTVFGKLYYVARALREAADDFIDLDDLAAAVKREPTPS